MTAVEVRNLSKSYSLSNSQWGRMRHLLGPGKPVSKDVLWALRDVSFSVERGEAFGIIGPNGSGKSTLLQLIAGILKPTAGSVAVNGRISALLELGSGFSPEFTGRDNVYLNGSLLGLTRDQIDARFADIERFAGIGSFIGQPIKTYSTGMVLRLAFAVAAHVDPEILIVDEALAVGDISFRQRCMRKIHDLRSRGVTILFVSHESSDVKALCERCLWLEHGGAQGLGEADAVVGRYLSATLRRESIPADGGADGGAGGGFATDFERGFEGHRYGDGRATILSGMLLGASGKPVSELNPLERVVVRIRFRANAPIDSAIAGFLVRNDKGENIFGTNTARENYPLPLPAIGKTGTVDFHWQAPRLAAGVYSVSLAIASGNLEEYAMCDYLEDAVTVQVGEEGVRVLPGYLQLRCAAVTVHHG